MRSASVRRERARAINEARIDKAIGIDDIWVEMAFCDCFEGFFVDEVSWKFDKMEENE
jgi:hypothetical protein